MCVQTVTVQRTKDFFVLIDDVGKVAVGRASHPHLDHHARHVLDTDPMALQEPHHQFDVGGNPVSEIK